MKILGHNYKIIFDNKLDFNDRTAAQCSVGDLWIKISSLHPDTRQQEGLLHEIMEALNYHLALKLEHEKIEAFSEGLFQVLNDNGLWKEFDFKKLKR